MLNSEIHLSERVQARPGAVFRYFEDENLMKEWIEGLESFRYQDESAEQVGRRFLQTNRMGGRKVFYKGVVTAWDKPSRFGARVESDNYSYDMSFELRQEGEETLVLYRGQLALQGFWERLFAPVIRCFSRRVFARELKRLKSVAEGSRPSPL